MHRCGRHADGRVSGRRTGAEVCSGQAEVAMGEVGKAVALAFTRGVRQRVRRSKSLRDGQQQGQPKQPLS